MFFKSVTLQAAVDLGRDLSQILRSITNQPLKSVVQLFREQLFRTTEKFIKSQVEITGVSTIDWNHPLWRQSSLLCDGAVYVFADSVLRLGGISTSTSPSLEDKMKWYLETRYLKDLDRTDGEPMEFEWKTFQDSLQWEILDLVQKMMAELRCEPEQFQGRIIFMSMYKDIIW